jgi:rare lipoprotein A (peptidoglycan hydrolase)
VRTLPLGVIAALIAVAALVAVAGPALTRGPGTADPPGPGTFQPLVLDRAPNLTAADATTRAVASPAPSDPVLLEPGVAPVPARPANVRQPRVEARVTRKAPAWRVSEYSWYGPGFYGSGTACGQTYTRTILGVAHRTLPCGTKVTLRNPDNGRTITVRVIDRGPYVNGRTWDLSRGTCARLDNCYTSRIQWRLP